MPRWWIRVVRRTFKNEILRIDRSLERYPKPAIFVQLHGFRITINMEVICPLSAQGASLIPLNLVHSPGCFRYGSTVC